MSAVQTQIALVSSILFDLGLKDSSPPQLFPENRI
jgi:hypothetical protein